AGSGWAEEAKHLAGLRHQRDTLDRLLTVIVVMDVLERQLRCERDPGRPLLPLARLYRLKRHLSLAGWNPDAGSLKDDFIPLLHRSVSRAPVPRYPSG